MTGIRETLDYSKISALSRVCEKFATACAEEDLDLTTAYLAVGRLLGLQSVTSGPAPSQQREAQPVTPVEIPLTAEEANLAKKEARAEKARKLGVDPLEVNLTSDEAKAAKAAFRMKRMAPPTKGSEKEPLKGKSPSSQTSSGFTPHWATNSGFGRGGKLPGYQPGTGGLPEKGGLLDPTGMRDTVLTRIKELRRLTIRRAPWIIKDPCGLHMVEYANNWFRLKRQWISFQSNYKFDGLKDPMRGLPDLQKYEGSRSYMVRLTHDLDTQASEPNIFVLQCADSESFWEGDRPSKACPANLSDKVPGYLIDFLRKKAEMSSD